MATAPKDSVLSTLAFLEGKKKILFLTTSNRWSGEEGGEMPKSTRLAYALAKVLGARATVIDVTKLKIYVCEGNVSTARGNSCGQKKAALKDPEKNPSGNHRCWASVNNKDDELWKISKALLESDAVVFFGSVRWGQMNSIYQKLIERLTWLENRHSNLGESNILENIDTGLVVVGQNWNDDAALDVQKHVLSFFGFRVAPELCWAWQYTQDSLDETPESYKNAPAKFEADILSVLNEAPAAPSSPAA